MPGGKNKTLSSFVSVTIVLFVHSVAPKISEGTQDGGWDIKTAGFSDGAISRVTFRSKIDGSGQPLLVKVPKGYTPEKSWPLLVTLHGLGDGPILAAEVDSMVQVGPYGRGSVGYTGIGQADVFECIEVAKEFFCIDEDRLYLCGFSMGAIATFDLGLRYPDIWAACVPVCGVCDDPDLIENGRELPFWIHAGGRDMRLGPQGVSRPYTKATQLGYAGWKYTEHEDMGHSFNIDWKEVASWLCMKKRAANPRRVSFCTKDLRSNRAYWLEITEIEKYGGGARVEAVIDGQKISIETENVANYTIRLNSNLVDLSKEVTIVENGVGIFCGVLTGDGCFSRRGRSSDGLFKRPGLSGPLWDIYSSLCILVYGGNSTDDSLVTAAKHCAESFSDPEWMSRVAFRVVADSDVRSSDLKGNNLVLFGNTGTNKVLAKVSEELPIQMRGDCITAKDVQYSGENVGYVLIYPNPANTNKYVAVLSGNTADAIDCFERIWPRLNSVPTDIDFGVFELTAERSSFEWLLKGVFDSNWGWQ